MRAIRETIWVPYTIYKDFNPSIGAYIIRETGNFDFQWHFGVFVTAHDYTVGDKGHRGFQNVTKKRLTGE